MRSEGARSDSPAQHRDAVVAAASLTQTGHCGLRRLSVAWPIPGHFPGPEIDPTSGQRRDLNPILPGLGAGKASGHGRDASEETKPLSGTANHQAYRNQTREGPTSG